MKNELYMERLNGNGLKNLNSAAILKITPPQKKFGARGWHKESFLKIWAQSDQKSIFNPLWGHCQEYKIEKNAVLQERLLSEKRSTFAHSNLTLSESFCLTDHEKQIQKFVAHWKVCQKSSQREVIRKNAYIAPKPQSVLLPALHLKFSRSLTNFQASPARHSPFRSKDRRPSHAVVWIAAGIERWPTVHSQLSKPDTKTRPAYTSTVGRRDEGKRNFGGSKRQLFQQNEGLFKASAASLVSQLHAREKWRPYGNYNYQK